MSVIETTYKNYVRKHNQRTAYSIAQGSQAMQDELRKYATLVGASDILKGVLGVQTGTQVVPHMVELILINPEIIPPKEVQLYTGNSQRWDGLYVNKLSRNELLFLIGAFIRNKEEGRYIVELVFYENGFLKKDLIDFLDVLQSSEELFTRVQNTKQQILKLVEKDGGTTAMVNKAANDANYTPISERISDLEPGYFNYLEEILTKKLHFVESLFCHLVMLLAENPENHIWALDPELRTFFIPEELISKVKLIQSICEFYGALDSRYHQLHKLLEGTVRAWIFLYKGFSSPKKIGEK